MTTDLDALPKSAKAFKAGYELGRKHALIEAARREAGLREALADMVAAYLDTHDGLMIERRNAIRSLLHDNAGTATGDEVGEP